MLESRPSDQLFVAPANYSVGMRKGAKPSHLLRPVQPPALERLTRPQAEALTLVGVKILTDDLKSPAAAARRIDWPEVFRYRFRITRT